MTGMAGPHGPGRTPTAVTSGCSWRCRPTASFSTPLATRSCGVRMALAATTTTSARTVAGIPLARSTTSTARGFPPRANRTRWARWPRRTITEWEAPESSSCVPTGVSGGRLERARGMADGGCNRARKAAAIAVRVSSTDGVSPPGPGLTTRSARCACASRRSISSEWRKAGLSQASGVGTAPLQIAAVPP